MPGSAGQIGIAIRDAPEVVAYLQCDARSSDAVVADGHPADLTHIVEYMKARVR